jgi:uncharacterized membrane protein
MDLQRYKVVFIAVVLLAALFVASPALQRILVYPSTQSASFSELWLLGPEKKAENYPYDIANNENYTVYLGLADQLGSCAYYQVEVKFCNSTQEAPNSFNHTSSSQPSLYTMNIFVPNTGSLEIPVSFSLDYSYDNVSRIDFNRLSFNGLPLSLHGYSTTWDTQRNAFYGNLVFELWIYNSTTNAFQYHDRYVSLQLNMAQAA